LKNKWIKFMNVPFKCKFCRDIEQLQYIYPERIVDGKRLDELEEED